MAPFKLPNTAEITRRTIRIKNSFLRNALSECIGTFLLLVSLASFSDQKNFDQSMILNYIVFRLEVYFLIPF